MGISNFGKLMEMVNKGKNHLLTYPGTWNRD